MSFSYPNLPFVCIFVNSPCLFVSICVSVLLFDRGNIILMYSQKNTSVAHFYKYERICQNTKPVTNSNNSSTIL